MNYGAIFRIPEILHWKALVSWLARALLTTKVKMAFKGEKYTD